MHEDPLEATRSIRTRDRLEDHNASGPPVPPERLTNVDPAPQPALEAGSEALAQALAGPQEQPSSVAGIAADRAEAPDAEASKVEPQQPGLEAGETPPPAAPTTEWTQAVPTAPERGGSLAAWLPKLSLVLILIAGAAAFKWWKYDFPRTLGDLRSEVRTEIEGLSTKLDAIRGESAASATREAELRTALVTKDSELAAALSELREAHQGLDAAVTELALRTPRGADELVLAEVEMLVAMAQEHLDLNRDMTTALAAMEAADRRLRRLGRPDLKAVREQVIHDVNNLRAVQLADIPGSSLFLADLMGRVERLPLLGDLPTRPPPPDTAAKPVAIERWQDLLRAVWADLLNLVSIKRLESKDPMLFDAEFRRLLQQSLRIELANARLDLLHRDTAGFRASLDLVGETLRRYFDRDDPEIASALERLKELRALELNPDLPDLSGSLQLLRDYALEQERAVGPAAEPIVAPSASSPSSAVAAPPERAVPDGSPP